MQEIKDYAGRNKSKKIYFTWDHSDDANKESYKNVTKPIGGTKEITLFKAQNFTVTDMIRIGVHFFKNNLNENYFEKCSVYLSSCINGTSIRSFDTDKKK